MSVDYFTRLERSEESAPMDEFVSNLRFNADGLIPVVAQRAGDGRALMLAWMNREALAQTIQTGDMTYYSRSRRKLWRKGETSGNTQRLLELRADCDGDSLLAVVRQNGPACHTGRDSCFFFRVQNNGNNGRVVVRAEPPEHSQ